MLDGSRNDLAPSATKDLAVHPCEHCLFLVQLAIWLLVIRRYIDAMFKKHVQ